VTADPGVVIGTVTPKIDTVDAVGGGVQTIGGVTLSWQSVQSESLTTMEVPMVRGPPPVCHVLSLHPFNPILY